MAEQHSIDSGVAFPDATTADISVQGTFLESGNQLQQLFIGLEPVILIQPEFDAEENEVKFLVTAVDLDPAGLIEVLDVLRDAAEEMVRQQEEETSVADHEHELSEDCWCQPEVVTNYADDQELAQLPETPEG